MDRKTRTQLLLLARNLNLGLNAHDHLSMSCLKGQVKMPLHGSTIISNTLSRPCFNDKRRGICLPAIKLNAIAVFSDN